MLTLFLSTKPAFTSKTYCAGSFDVYVSQGSVWHGAKFCFMSTIVKLEEIKIISSGINVFFIQNLRFCSSGKTKSMPLLSFKWLRNIRPRFHFSGVSAISAETEILPASVIISTVFIFWVKIVIYNVKNPATRRIAMAIMMQCLTFMATIKYVSCLNIKPIIMGDYEQQERYERKKKRYKKYKKGYERRYKKRIKIE